MNQKQLKKLQELENRLKKLQKEENTLKGDMHRIGYTARNNLEKKLIAKTREIEEVSEQIKNLKNSTLTKEERRIKNLETKLNTLRSNLNIQEIELGQVSRGNNPSSPYFQEYRNAIERTTKEIQEVERQLKNLKKK